MYDMNHLNRLPALRKAAKDGTDAFWQYDQRALKAGALDKKTKELMAIAVALTTQCPYCLEVHKKAALEAGATQEELAETVHVAAALRAGAAITHGTMVLDA